MLAMLALAESGIKVPIQTQRTWAFPQSDIHVDCNFSSARLDGIKELGTNRFLIFVTPENEPINTSPWYAFKISSAHEQMVTLEFTNTYTTHRGIPRLSEDGEIWQRANTDQFTHATKTTPPTLRLEVGSKPTWVAAWDLANLTQIEAWTEKISIQTGSKIQSAGRTLEDRPIHYFVLGNPQSTNYVFVIGRQHPPEITGTIGLQSFVETIAGGSTLATEFLNHFQVVIVPVVNPDGVEHGHWRSNLGGVDLNRDWQHFSQPETRAVRDLISKFAAQPQARLWLFVDFHSTGTNVFYAQPELAGDFNSGFTTEWLAMLHKRLPEFLFERDDSHNAELATGKAWVNGHFHIPAITCEFGYNTDRKLIRSAAQAQAEIMIKILQRKLAFPN